MFFGFAFRLEVSGFEFWHIWLVYDPCEGVLPAVEGRPLSSVHTLVVYMIQLRLLRVISMILPFFKLFSD